MNKDKDTSILLRQLLSETRVLMLGKQYEKAVNIFDRILDINPYLDDIWLMKGATLQILRDYKGALECYNQALKINPSNTKAQIGKVTIETHLENQPTRRTYNNLDLTEINKNVRKLVQENLKNDTLFQEEFILTKKEDD